MITFLSFAVGLVKKYYTTLLHIIYLQGKLQEKCCLFFFLKFFLTSCDDEIRGLSLPLYLSPHLLFLSHLGTGTGYILRALGLNPRFISFYKIKTI